MEKANLRGYTTRPGGMGPSDADGPSPARPCDADGPTYSTRAGDEYSDIDSDDRMVEARSRSQSVHSFEDIPLPIRKNRPEGWFRSLRRKFTSKKNSQSRGLTDRADLRGPGKSRGPADKNQSRKASSSSNLTAERSTDGQPTSRKNSQVQALLSDDDTDVPPIPSPRPPHTLPELNKRITTHARVPQRQIQEYNARIRMLDRTRKPWTGQRVGSINGHVTGSVVSRSGAITVDGYEEYDLSRQVRELFERMSPQNHEWNLTSELVRLSKNGWYWGPLTRQEAEDKLTDQQDGAFLVRDSSDERYLLSLSFRSFGRTLHTRIEHCNGVFSFYAQPESEGYTSIIELIEHSMTDSASGIFCYSRSRNPGSPSFPVRLTKPVSRFTRVRTLQYLCRFVIRQYTRVDHIQNLPLPTKIKGWLEQSQY